MHPISNINDIENEDFIELTERLKSNLIPLREKFDLFYSYEVWAYEERYFREIDGLRYFWHIQFNGLEESNQLLSWFVENHNEEIYGGMIADLEQRMKRCENEVELRQLLEEELKQISLKVKKMIGLVTATIYRN